MLDPIADQSVDEKTTLRLQARVSGDYVPAEPLSFSLDPEWPAGAAIDAETGWFSWTPTEAEGPGEYEFTVRATDARGLSDTETFIVMVNEVNEPPHLDPIGDRTTDLGTTLSFTATASDPDLPANELVFSIDSGAPDGATIDAASGTVTWTPSSPGTFPITVRVRDDGTPALDDSETFQLAAVCANGMNGFTGGETGGSADGRGGVTVVGCNAVLSEGDSFEVTLEGVFQIPDDRTLVRFTLEGLDFDLTDPVSMNDAFEVAVTDALGHSLVHTFLPERDAFLNVSEESTLQVGAGTTFDGQQYSVDLSGVAAGTEATFVFRLVNNDSDQQTTVRVTSFEMLAGAGQGEQSIVYDTAGITLADTVDFTTLSDISASTALEFGTTSFDQQATTLFSDVTVVNQGQYLADAPLVLVIDNVSDPGISAASFDGRTPEGLPYYDFSPLIDDGTLEAGERTLSRTIAFRNPSGVQFDFAPIVLAQLNRAPQMISQPDSEALTGQDYAYDVDASDADHDELTYELLSAPIGMTIDSESGLIQWSPQRYDVGSHSILVRVTDGRGGNDQQSYQLEVREIIPNRPPMFISEPVLDATVATYFEVVDVPVGDQPSALAVGDFTGQGFLSVISANPGDQSVSVAAGGSGDGYFARSVELGIGDPPPEVWRQFYEPLPVTVGFADPMGFSHDVVGIARGDFNHDGFLDLAAAPTKTDQRSAMQSYVVVTLGNGDGTFQSPTKIMLPVAPTASGLLARDFDRDGELDLIAVSSTDSQVYFLQGQGDGSFADPVAAGTTADGPQTALTADLNGDHILDLVINSPGRDEIAVLPGLGDGTFDTAVVLPTGDNPSSFSLTDVDNSGSVDLVIGCYQSLQYEVRLNDGAGQFGEPIITPFYIRDIVPGTGPERPTGFYAADFDEDGFVDLAGDSLGGWFVFFRGDGTGNFAAAIAVENPTAHLFRYYTDNDLPDFNGDGRPDLLFANGFG